MKSFLIYLVALLVVTNCNCGTGHWRYKQGIIPEHVATVKVIPVWLDTNFSAQESKAIKDSIKEWNSVFNGQLVIRQEGEFNGKDQIKKYLIASKVMHQGWSIIRLNSNDSTISDVVETGDGTLAFVFGIGTGNLMVVVGDHIGLRDLKTIVMHEMGHLLGAYHVNARSLMSPKYGIGKDEVDCIDKVTVAQVAGYQNLNLKELNYCVTPDFE